MDIPVFGISRDPVETHLEFKKAHKLPFDLLADTNGQVAELYKATIPRSGLPAASRTCWIKDTALWPVTKTCLELKSTSIR